MARSMRPEQIHKDMLSFGAIRGQDDDGLTHFILRKAANFADLEYASDGSYSLQMRVNGKTYSADGRNMRRMARVWKQWQLEGK